MFVCEFCDSECYSASAQLACEERCEEETRNYRGWTARANPHRKD